jgi:hypothetical protein
MSLTCSNETVGLPPIGKPFGNRCIAPEDPLNRGLEGPPCIACDVRLEGAAPDVSPRRVVLSVSPNRKEYEAPCPRRQLNEFIVFEDFQQLRRVNPSPCGLPLYLVQQDKTTKLNKHNPTEDPVSKTDSRNQFSAKPLKDWRQIVIQLLLNEREYSTAFSSS